MKKALLLLLVVVAQLALLANGNPSKNAVAHGVVIDAGTGDPITGARVILEATGEVAYTDENGEFALPYATAQVSEIRIEFVSFQTTKVLLGEQHQTLHIQLVELP